MRQYIVAIMMAGLTSLSAYSVKSLEKSIYQELKQKSTLTEHKVIGSYPFVGSKKILMISTNRLPENEQCMACPATLSLFVFLDGKLIKSYIDMLKAGVMGKAPNGRNFKMITIGEGKDALFLKTFSPAQGYDIHQNYIYLLEDSRVKKVFDAMVGINNEAFGMGKRTAWKATLDFDKTKSPYHDIILHKKGIEEEQAIDEKIVYKFDGEKYEK